MNKPIEPDQIRVGDTVRPIDTGTAFFVKEIRAGYVGDGARCIQATIIQSSYWSRTWELIERPESKPEIGSLWISAATGDTYVFAQNDQWVLIKSHKAPRSIGWTLRLSEHPVEGFRPVES
jgi:hypothetical protein